MSSAALVFHNGAVSGKLELYEANRIIDFGMSGNGTTGLEDPDLDGVPMLIEYVLGGSPTEADMDKMPSLETTSVTGENGRNSTLRA